MKKMVLLAAAGVVASLVACATSTAPDAPATAAADELAALGVTSDDESTLVTLVGVREADVTVGEHSDPWSLSVDLGSVPLAHDMSPVAVYDGRVDQVSASSFEDEMGSVSTRIEIALAGESAHEIETTADGLAIRIFPAGATSADAWDGESMDAADAGDAEADVWGEGAVAFDDEAAEVEAPVAVAPPPAAQRLTRVDVESVEGGVLVHLVADGVIGATESFVLTGPDRLVVDLPGLASDVKTGRVTSGSMVVPSVRIGAHADKVRVVMDGGAEAMGFQSKRVMPAPDGLFVTVGEGEPIDAALMAAMESSNDGWASRAPTTMAEATAPATEELELAVADEPGDEIADDLAEDLAEDLADEMVVEDEVIASADDSMDSFETAPTAAPMGAPVNVFGVEYEADAERGVERIAVLASGPVKATWMAPDAETVVVRIPNAVVAKEAEGRIAPRKGSPLSLISVFQQPEMTPSEVRVVVKRTADLAPEIASIGSNVFVEFPAKGLAAEAATVAEAETPAVMDTPLAASLDAGAPEVAVDLESELPMFDEPMVADDVVAVAEPLAGLAPASVGAPPAALEPPAAIEVLQEGGLIDGKQYRGRRISLDFKDVAIADVLRLIADVSDLNIISGDEVQGNVSIRLVEVPWDQALDVILLTKGLGFVRVGNVLRIAPADVLAQEEEVRLQERRAKEKLEDLVVKLIPVNYGDVKSMQNLVKRLLTARGSVNLDERTSTLIVKDIASVVDESTALVAAVDTETPQVMIEAKIVEAKLDFKRELGSVWSLGRNQRVDPFDSSSAVDTTLGSSDFRWSPSNFRTLEQANNVSFLNNITATPTGLFNLSAFILDEQFNLDVQLQAAEESGNGKVVSSPRVVTLDNTEAEVEQGVSIPFQTFENGDAKLEFIDAVLSLKVTPHITSNKSIIMKIEVTRDAPDATVATPTGSPAIAKNQAKTETLVKDGQTLVMGGIYTVENALRQTRVPYLHRIPIFGTAFKSKEVDDNRKELLIFVTPRIVVQPEAS